eukprot:3406728-Amphidinium_carterae.1
MDTVLRAIPRSCALESAHCLFAGSMLGQHSTVISLRKRSSHRLDFVRAKKPHSHITATIASVASVACLVVATHSHKT